ncbi:MAG: CvpA family protein [Elusimicrobia bacterium]|nr:CvpA family protein [Elusimicrobiota bacterium]
MTIDLAILSLVLLSGLLGLASGAIKQAAHLIGMAFAYLAALPLAAALTPMLAQKLGYPPAAVKVGLSVACFSVLYGVGTFAALCALRKLAGDREKSRLDRAAGFVLGAGKAGVVVFVMLSAVLFFEKPLVQALGKTPEKIEQSNIIALVRRHNLFDAIPFPALDKIQRLMNAAKDPKAAQELMSDPKLKELLNDPKLKEVLQDESVAKALRSGDISALLNNPRIAALLKDSRIAEQ